MFKIMILIKRRAGMSMDDFIDYYENHHAPLGLRAVPNMKGYTRRYLTPLGGEELAYDVATEIVFDDEADFGRAMEHLNEPATRAEVDADEERLFDRSTITFMKVDERSSDIPARA
ncbi:MAG TPA: EthD domain-containing protein [Acidimicrobiia bacterium]|nr:EthD domain-containing protein [Acidimicrobiia bacterium]